MKFVSPPLLMNKIMFQSFMKIDAFNKYKLLHGKSLNDFEKKN